jgi:hypothetical protein
VNVREAEGEPVLDTMDPEANALLKEVPNQNEAATLTLALTFPGSPNTVNKSVKFLARDNHGLVTSVVHCPGQAPGPHNPTRSPQPTALDGGLFPVTADSPAPYGQVGAVSDGLASPEGSWFMEAGHSIARTPDGPGYTGCRNCHADTVRLGREPITYYRKQPWVMRSIGVPEAIMPASHFAANEAMVKNGSNWNCNCHDNGTGLVHNGTFEGPWPARNVVPFDEFVSGPVHEPNGAEIYNTNCKACHFGTVDVANDKVTGMTLGGVPSVALTYDVDRAKIDQAITSFMPQFSSMTSAERDKLAAAIQL